MAATDDPATNAPAGAVTANPDVAHETAATRAPLDRDLLALPPDATLREYTSAWVKRVRNGESGVLPVVLGLIVIIVIFQIEKSVFSPPATSST